MQVMDDLFQPSLDYRAKMAFKEKVLAKKELGFDGYSHSYLAEAFSQRIILESINELPLHEELLLSLYKDVSKNTYKLLDDDFSTKDEWLLPRFERLRSEGEEEVFDWSVWADFLSQEALLKVKSDPDLRKEVFDNPWCLAEEKLLKFSGCDELARALQVSLRSKVRFESYLRLIFEELMESTGSIYFEKSVFIKALEAVSKNEEEAKAAFSWLLKEGLIFEKKSLGLSLYSIIDGASLEEEISALILKLSRRNLGVIDYSKDQLHGLSEGQKLAVEGFLTKPLSLVYGVPGSGKTTVVRRALSLSGVDPKDILLVAPTGRAAAELSFKCQLENARTIHRALKDKAFKGKKILVVDESSMLDLILARDLLKEIDENCRCLFLGDPEQIESIGRGKFFEDLLKTELKKSSLTKVFRQSEDSLIYQNSKAMREGSFEIKEGSDFNLFNCRSKVAIDNAIKQYLKELAQGREVVILCPHKKADRLGTDYLNRRIAKEISGQEGFFRGAQIVCTKNMKVSKGEKDFYLANGSRGRFVSALETGARLLFQNELIEVSQNELRFFELAFATSIHKSQGGEFDRVILLMPLFDSQYFFVDKKAIYTAITRAKEGFSYFGSRRLFLDLIKGKNDKTRISNLKELIEEKI